MTSALDTAPRPPLPVRKLHDPCRSLGEVRAEMIARLEDVGSRQAARAMWLLPRAPDLDQEARALGRWIGTIDAELARRAAALPPEAHVAGLCDWSAGLSEGEP